MAKRNPTVKLSYQPTWGTPDNLASGLNWFLHKTLDSQRPIEHSDGTFGFTSYCDMYPDRQTGVVLLANDPDNATQNQLGLLSARLNICLL